PHPQSSAPQPLEPEPRSQGGGARGNQGFPRDQYPSRRTSSRRSRAKKWIPSTNRTQLQRVHMTSECVRALSARKRTPRRRSPFETPVAATITSPEARSSVLKTRP